MFLYFNLSSKNTEFFHQYKKMPLWDLKNAKLEEKINKLKNIHQHFHKVTLLNFKMVLISKWQIEV